MMDKQDVAGIVIFTLIVGLITGAQAVYPWTGTTNTLSNGYLEVANLNATTYYTPTGELGFDYPASYVISTDGTNIYAMNGSSGERDYSGTNITAIWEDVRDSGLTSGRNWKEKVVFKGYFILDSPIIIESYTVAEMQANFTLENGADVNMIEFASGAIYIDLYGGVLDGNKSGQAATVHGIEFNSNAASNIHIHDMKIFDMRGDGINIESSSNLAWIYNNRISGCNRYGIYAAALADSIIKANQIGYSGINNINIGSTNNYLTNNIVWSAGVDGYYIGEERNTLIGNRGELNNRSGIYVSNQPFIQLIGNRLYNNGQNATEANKYRTGIYIGNNAEVTVNDNVLLDNQGVTTQLWGIYLAGNGVTGIFTGNQENGTTNGLIFLPAGVDVTVNHNLGFTGLGDIQLNAGTLEMYNGTDWVVIE